MADAREKLDCPDSEIVFAFTYAVGTDAQKVEQFLSTYLHNKYNYELHEVRLSDYLKEFFPNQDFDSPNKCARWNKCMDFGTRLRRNSKNEDIFAWVAAAKILARRQSKTPDGKLSNTLHLIRSLKRPEEVHALRKIYGSGFFLIGLYSSFRNRLNYLSNEMMIPDKEAKGLIKKDADEKIEFGQQTTNTFELADVFIDYEDTRAMRRFVDLVFGSPIIPPTAVEEAMHLAYAASTRSAELSRQVGAAILAESGDVLGIGANEVPAAGGGQYGRGASISSSMRDFEFDKKCDVNHSERARIVESVKANVAKSLGINDGRRLSKIKSALEKTDVKGITEFGRSVHAEMEAILSCARNGISTRGAILFSTTFPCHNCARHIIDAGIKEVYFIEPYPKSRALDLHIDAIMIQGEEGDEDSAKGRVVFRPFIGVGPRRYFDLFSMRLGSGRALIRKKEDGTAITDNQNLGPRVQLYPTSYIEREKLCMLILKSLRPKRARRTG
ncbi:MAG: hypothetical protein AMXMBFR7_39100 [Planctomycetota bacterium]